MQIGNEIDKKPVLLQVAHVDKKKQKCVKRGTEGRGCNCKTGSTSHKLGAERTQGRINRGGGEREMSHGAVMLIERALNVFNIT